MQSDYKINLRFVLNREGGGLYVSKPEGGDEAKASGFTRDVHGWGKEIHLLHLIRKRLEQAGIYLARKKVQGDKQFFHMFGDEHMCYLRTPTKAKSTMPHFWIIDDQYAVRPTANEYNKGETVRFQITGDIFQEEGKPPKQPNWWKLLYDLCVSGGVPCELSDELIQEIAA